MARLLTAVSAPQADEVEQDEDGAAPAHLRRAGARREAQGWRHADREPAATGNLKPWREVVTPHADVASGRYQQAEFAADLWQVHLGEGTDEYRKPAEFFRRTFLTESLKRLLVGACSACPARAATRSFSSRPTSAAARPTRCWRSITCSRALRRASCAGVDAVLAEAGVEVACRRRSASCWWATRSRPATRHEAGRHGRAHAVGRAGLAARRQEGLRSASRQDDEKATSPGDVLRELFERVRALPDPDRRMGRLRAPAPRPERPAGRQLRDAVHLRPGADASRPSSPSNCLLVISLPASDTAGSPHTQARRRGGRRHPRARGARPAAQRGRARGILLAAGHAPRRASRSSAAACSSR